MNIFREKPYFNFRPLEDEHHGKIALYFNQNLKAPHGKLILDVTHYKDKIKNIQDWRWRKTVHISNDYECIPTICTRKISRAYFKLWEIIVDFNFFHSFKQGSTFTSVHLCEGPGGFIEAIQDFTERMSMEWKWKALTLKPDKKDRNLPDFDSKISDNMNDNICYGHDGTGNIYNTSNIKHLQAEVFSSVNSNGVMLVTADGGFDVSEDPSMQESASAKIIFAQILSAFHVQAIGGCFIIKIFDTMLPITIDMIHILRMHYTMVTVCKPLTSRPCNSEKYIICGNFKGVSEDTLQRMSSILQTFDSSQPFRFFKRVSDVTQRDLGKGMDPFYIQQKGALLYALSNVQKINYIQKKRFDTQIEIARKFKEVYQLM